MFGSLTSENRVDRAGVQRLREASGGVDVVFHRAFDVVENPFDELEVLIDMGIKRILTSGQAPTALEGAELLRELTTRADSRIEILPGAGVGPHNASRLVGVSDARSCTGLFAIRRAHSTPTCFE